MIGGKRWMAENLNHQPKTGKSWCYENDTSNCGKYGRLYDWNTATKACPSGWYLPSHQEWERLVFAARGDDMCLTGGGWAGKRLRARNGWNHCSDHNIGTDEYGFSALPGGYRKKYDFDTEDGGAMHYDNGGFKEADSGGYWWTAAEDGYSGTYARRLSLRYNDYGVSDNIQNKGDGLSVRCILGDGGGVTFLGFNDHGGRSVRCVRDD